MPKIYIQGRIVETPLLQADPARTLRVCLDTPANVTVNFSSERGLFTVTPSLTFTAGNYNLFQNLTITPVNAGSWSQGAADYIIATATGFTSIRKKIYVFYTDQGKFVRNFAWINNIHINSQSDVATLRNYVKNFNHNNNYPTGHTPDAITSSFTGAMHATSTSFLSGFSSVTKLDWNLQDINGDTWTHSTFYIQASSPSNPRKLLFVHGSNSDPNMASMINKPLSRGYDVMYTALPVTHATHIASARSPLITLTGLAGYNQILSAGIDRDGYNGIEIFLFDKVKALNYAENLGIYGNRIYQYCYSGGSTSAMFLHIQDERISKTYIHKGWVPREWVQSPNPLSVHASYANTGDADGTSTYCGPRRYTFGSNVSTWDMLILGNSNGRQLTIGAHYNDSAGAGGTWYDIVEEKINVILASFGGSWNRMMFTNPANASHNFYDSEIDTILDDMES